MEYKHFSHPHNLTIHQLHELGHRHHQLQCSGCHSACDNTAAAVHGCHHCNFFLHAHCATTNRHLNHPYHKPHPLILLPHPTYAAGSFICNACGRAGKSFSYCCALCEVDLHIGCAFLPLAVTHKAHHHEIALYYGAPVIPRRGSNSDVEICKICGGVVEGRNWKYCCDKCDFSAHTFCATTEVVPELYQDDSPEGMAADGGGDGGGGGNEVEVELTEEDIIRLFNMKLHMQQLAQTMASLSTLG